MKRIVAGVTGLLAVAFLAGAGKVPSEKAVNYSAWSNKPSEAFADGPATLEKVKSFMLRDYYRDDLSESDVFRAAVQGVLELSDPRMKSWNRLLSPGEYAEVKVDMQGEIVGMGIHISFDSESGIVDILDVIKGSPAERAGLLPGDKLLNVNGKFYKGNQLRDVVYAIRGKEGDRIKLTILRDDKLLQKSAKLERLAFDSVEVRALSNGTSLLKINYFTSKTPSHLRAALERLKNGERLVIDLRGNAGGVFDEAVESTGFFVPKGKTIVLVSKRGGTEEAHTSQHEPVWKGKRLVVLVDGETSSGAEIMASALRDNLGAVLVGEKTRGKWSVQKIEELGNGWAAKYTVGAFRSSAGRDYEGKGLEPDVCVVGESKERPRGKSTEDPQLRSALAVLNQ